jgi:hypothetical protein
MWYANRYAEKLVVHGKNNDSFTGLMPTGTTHERHALTALQVLWIKAFVKHSFTFKSSNNVFFGMFVQSNMKQTTKERL